MEFSRNRIIKIVLTLIFLCCMLFANFIAIRMMLRYGVDTYFYDKLLVAYTIGGADGLKMELDKIPLTDKLPRELMLVKDFSAKLVTLTDPEAFLKNSVQMSKSKALFVRKLRNAAMVVMFILFVWQLMASHIVKLKSKKSS